LNKNADNRPSLLDLLHCPEINVRVREMRYQMGYADLLRREERLRRKEEELGRR